MARITDHDAHDNDHDNDNSDPGGSDAYKQALRALGDNPLGQHYFNALTAGKLPGRTYPVVKYFVVPLADGSFAVEARAHGFRPAQKGGFKTAKDAEEWVGSNTSDL